MTEQYAGTCPICGVTLIVGNKLRCPDKHYTCDRRAFERRWNAFQEIVTKRKLQNIDFQFDLLMKDLLKMNIVAVNPDLIAAFQEKQKKIY